MADLYLKVEIQEERECKHGERLCDSCQFHLLPNTCSNDGMPTIVHLPKCISYIKRDCPLCHGTGKRTVRKVAMVPVEVYLESPDEDSTYLAYESVNIELDVMVRDFWDAQAREKHVAKPKWLDREALKVGIVELYHAHTLPAEIAGLFKEEVNGPDKAE